MEIGDRLLSRRFVLIDEDDPSWLLGYRRTCSYNNLSLFAIGFFLLGLCLSSRIADSVLGGLGQPFHFLGKKALHLLN